MLVCPEMAWDRLGVARGCLGVRCGGSWVGWGDGEVSASKARLARVSGGEWFSKRT